jgi:hypothetical protein
MRKIFFFFSMILLLSSKKSNAQTQDANLTALLAINESQYINKPLDSIISVLPSGYIRMKVYGNRNTARQVLVLYPNKVWIELHVREFTHMNPEDYNRAWNLSLMRQEKLYKSVIFQKHTCYRNCDVSL